MCFLHSWPTPPDTLAIWPISCVHACNVFMHALMYNSNNEQLVEMANLFYYVAYVWLYVRELLLWDAILSSLYIVPPSVPFQVTADPANIGPTFIHICWQQGSDMGTPPLSFFHILVQPSNMYYTTNGTYFNVTGLLPGTEYEFIVTAVSVSGDVEGESEPSHPRIITTIVTGLKPFTCTYM